MKRILISVFAMLLTVAGAAAQNGSTAQTILILPFENVSKAPGLEWVGEAFPEILGQRMGSASLFVVPREDRAYAFDRAGIPVNVRPSRATLFRIGEQMDCDFLIMGRYNFDGSKLTASAQLLDVKKLRLLPGESESGPLTSLIEVQTALAWDLLRVVNPAYHISRNEFVASSPPIRLDAFEAYVRGITATTRPEKIQRFREAVRLNASYSLAMFQLGRTYFAGKDWDQAASWLSRVPKTAPEAREANFYAGLAYYYAGDFGRAESAFDFIASQFPLTEVQNNLGVAIARRGKPAAEYFQKAVDNDPRDPDYRFNLALALYRAGDAAGAARQLTEALKLRPSDGEAKSLLELANNNTVPNPAQALPRERIKSNYDESSFRQLALEIQNATEARLAKTDPKTHAAYHVSRGADLLRQQFVAEAGQEFREAISLYPSSAAAHAGLAGVLEASNDLPGAHKEASYSLGLQPTVEAYLVLARLNLRENNAEAAAANVERALALEPSNTVAVGLKHTITARLAEKPQQQQ